MPVKERGTFYVTTPIYYVNDVPHIGHAYTTVAADCLARFKRLRLGKDRVFFLTGTDEHGQKVEKAAAAKGVDPLTFAGSVVTRFKDLWALLNISNNDFIRTTEERHRKAAISIWKTISEKGDIYLGTYEDWYCTPCENFLTEKELVNLNCPNCGRPVEKLKEPSYFFRLSRYRSPLLEYIKRNERFIRPESKRNEIKSFLELEELRDLSVSRTTFRWGIPVPDDPGHVMYVWFDALTNYLTATGYPDNSHRNKDFWPADVHIIGKDILRFHTVYWPAFLLSAGLPLPRQVFAHGWWTVDGQKMSKSKGNVVDPASVIEKYGVDQFRYFLLREVPFGLDGDFSIKALEGRINGDLANDLGNLLSRSISMIEKYTDGTIPPAVSGKDGDMEKEIRRSFNALNYINLMDGLEFHQALSGLWGVVRLMNAYVDKSAPWKLFKEKEEGALSNVLYTLAEGLRTIAVYLFPFMPASAEKIWDTLGMDRKIEDVTDFDREVKWGGIRPEQKVKKCPPLFPRIEAKQA